MNRPVENDLDEGEALRAVINALRADNGRLLRLLIAGFVSDGRPEHKELTEEIGRSSQVAELAGRWRSEFWMPTKSRHPKAKQ